ncbi:MAG: hypothetical protein IPK87_03395 [Planctomycetes bacterium]|nr:hypothetical protein [Planctomycetota bacterium]
MPDTELHALLDEYLHGLELEEARELSADAPPNAELRAHVEEAYWRAARQACASAVHEPPGETLALSEDGTLLIDLALFDHSALADASRKLAGGPGRFRLVHHALEDSYRAVLRMPILERLKARLELISRDIREWPETHLLHVRFRDRRCLELFDPSPVAQQVLRLFSEMDEQLESYVRLERRMRGVRSPDAKDAAEWREIRDFMTSRRDAIRKHAGPMQRQDPEGAALMEAAAEAVVESVSHLLELQAVRRDVEGDLAETEDSRRAATADEVRAALHAELGDVRALVRLAARYSGVPEQALPLPGMPLISADDAASALDHVLTYDPLLFTPIQQSRFDPPSVLLVPGTGLGVYDPARNRMVIPRRCPSEPIASLAHAAVMFRLHIDTEESDGHLLESYRAGAHADGRLRSKLKLKNAFVHDYLAWMTHETREGNALAREARHWFEAAVAPAKDAPWLPPELVGLATTRITAEMRKLSRQPESADRSYRRALLEWLNGARDAETLKASVLPAMEDAVKLEPGSPRYLYSAAVLHMQAGSFQRALDYFARFTSLQPAGWWARSAAELCARCR